MLSFGNMGPDETNFKKILKTLEEELDILKNE